MIYTAFDNPGRGMRYMRDGKLISKDKIPPHFLPHIQPGQEFDTSKSCIFCGMHSNLSRLIAGQSASVCEVHYHEKTLGQVSQKLRELS